jgi:hypothetical protein
MMAYTKTAWVEGGAPAINASNLNKIEQGIFDAHTHIAAIGNPHGTTAAQVGALALAGGTMTGNIKFPTGKGLLSPGGSLAIELVTGDATGDGIFIGAGGATVIGAGESAQAFKEFLDSNQTEQLYLTSDNDITLYSNMQDPMNAKTMTFRKDGVLETNYGLIIKNINDVDFTHTRGFTLEGSDGARVSMDNNEMIIEKAGGGRNTFTIHTSSLFLDYGGGGREVYTKGAGIRWGTAAPSGGEDGDVYIEY